MAAKRATEQGKAEQTQAIALGTGSKLIDTPLYVYWERIMLPRPTHGPT